MFPKLDELAASRPDYNPNGTFCSEVFHEPKRRDRGPANPRGWLQDKDKLNGGDDVRTKSGAENLKAVKHYLSTGKLYDAIGVVEYWNESMVVFDKKWELDIPWGELEFHKRNHGSEAWEDEEAKALERARRDPVVLAAIAADIDLYENVILPRHAREFREARDRY